MPNRFSLHNPRSAIMAVFAAFGTCTGSLAGAMPAVSEAAGVGSLGIGLAITASTLATVFTMTIGGWLGRRTTNRRVLLFSLPLFALFTGTFLLSSSPTGFFVSFILLGAAIGATDLFMNAEGTAIEHDLKRPIFSAFHGGVSLSLALFAILSSMLTTLAGPWATALCVWLSFAAAWVMVYRFVPARVQAKGEAAKLSSLPRRMPLVLLGLAAGCIIAAEVASLLWSAKLLETQAPQLAAITGLGAAFYSLCNAAIRFPGDRLRSWLGDLPLMLISIAIAAAGFLLLGFSQSFALSVAAFALVGLGTAVLIPCVFALAAGFVIANRAAGIGFVSMIAGVPRTLAPWAFGWVAAEQGIAVAFGLCAILLAAAFACIVRLWMER